MGLDEIDVTLKLATLDEIDDVSNIPQGFSGIVILDVGPIICIVI